MERVPTEDNSIIVLETSAGNGFLLLFLVNSNKRVGSETTEEEAEHLGTWIENLGVGLLGLGLNGKN